MLTPHCSPSQAEGSRCDVVSLLLSVFQATQAGAASAVSCSPAPRAASACIAAPAAVGSPRESRQVTMTLTLGPSSLAMSWAARRTPFMMLLAAAGRVLKGARHPTSTLVFPGTGAPKVRAPEGSARAPGLVVWAMASPTAGGTTRQSDQGSTQQTLCQGHHV